jgi:16S rRNA processing protein RimM
LSALAAEWVLIARVVRSRGNKGEVAVELLTDFPERLLERGEVFLAPTGGTAEPERFQVSSFWIPQSKKARRSAQGVFHFTGVNSIAAAEQLRGRDVLLPIAQRVTLPQGMYFISDLVGCSVFEEVLNSGPARASSPCSLGEAPRLVGKVSGVELVGEQQQGTPVLHIDTAEGELLIPLAEDICFRIATRERRIDVRLPEGLRELNRPE